MYYVNTQYVKFIVNTKRLYDIDMIIHVTCTSILNPCCVGKGLQYLSEPLSATNTSQKTRSAGKLNEVLSAFSQDKKKQAHCILHKTILPKQYK